MTKKEVDAFLDGLFGYKCETWYAFQIQCDLFEHGCSNMSAPSKQEYCKRVPKRGTFFDYGMAGTRNMHYYKAGEARPAGQLMTCNWNVCPKLKKLIKDNK
jgi:hypothetical protein